MAGDFRFVQKTKNIMVKFFGGFESAIYPNAEMTAFGSSNIPFCSVLLACNYS
jgi:hypothetical protein